MKVIDFPIGLRYDETGSMLVPQSPKSEPVVRWAKLKDLPTARTQTVRPLRIPFIAFRLGQEVPTSKNLILMEETSPQVKNQFISAKEEITV